MQEIIYHTNYKIENEYWWFIARNQILGKIVNEFAKLNSKSKLLDVGCGTGAFAATFNDSVNVAGIDTSDIALQYAAKRGLKNLRNCYLKDFPKEEFQPDVITFLDVIEHIEDDKAVVKDAYNLLEKGGYVIASVPAYQWLWSHHDELHMHYRRYTKKRFMDLFKEAGFHVQYASYFNTLLFPLAALKRILDKITGASKKDNSPIEEVSPFVNSLFKNIFLAEKKALPNLTLPFGVSIVIVAKKL
ncbi:MAG TPA: class I SAM-dependent methyltransferase [Candidatus Kapabacteria bacterium]|nr:class I SAM-dependent methyltransferase [Candidatus Kapabacteria bacterium]